MANTIADVLWDKDRTESQLETDLRFGQVGSIASDSGSYLQKLEDGTVKRIQNVVGKLDASTTLQELVNNGCTVIYWMDDAPVTSGTVTLRDDYQYTFYTRHYHDGEYKFSNVVLSATRADIEVRGDLVASSFTTPPGYTMVTGNTAITTTLSIGTYLYTNVATVGGCTIASGTLTAQQIIGTPLGGAAYQQYWMDAQPESVSTLITDKVAESITGQAETQAENNEEFKNGIVSNKQAIAAGAAAFLSVASVNPQALSTTPVLWDFYITSPTTDAEVLTADAGANTITYKRKDVTYQGQAQMTVSKSVQQDRELTIQVKRVGTGAVIRTFTFDITGGATDERLVPIDVIPYQNTEDDYGIYYEAYADGTGLTINSLKVNYQSSSSGGISNPSAGTRNLNMSQDGLFVESNVSQDSNGVLGFNAPVHIGDGEWATTSIGRSLGRMGMFSSDSNPIHILANMSSVSADNGAYLKLGARATNGIANMTSVNYGGFKENSVDGDFKGYALIQLSDQSGGTVDGFRVNSLGVATLPSSSITKIKNGGGEAVVTIDVLDDAIPTASEIKTQYESNSDTNAFTDGYKAKVDAIPQWADWTSGSITLPDETGTWEFDGNTASTGSGLLLFDNLVSSGCHSALINQRINFTGTGTPVVTLTADTGMNLFADSTLRFTLSHIAGSSTWVVSGSSTDGKQNTTNNSTHNYMGRFENTVNTHSMTFGGTDSFNIKWRKIA